MKVVLKKSIDKLGRLGDTVNVADGYGRNFLIPQGIAVAGESVEAKKIRIQRSKTTPKVRKEKKPEKKIPKSVKRQKRIEAKEKKQKKS